MAMLPHDRERNFLTRGIGEANEDGTLSKSLSPDLPKPNILRVEVLDGNARQRYLAAVQRKGDNIRRIAYQQATQPGERIFYGFLVSGGETGFNMNTQWNKDTGSGAILGELKGIAGVIPGVNTIVGGATEIIDRIGEIGGSLLGINQSSTGSGTVKDFAGVGLQDYTIKCGWYLPEQYHLCVKSLKTIYRMAYPKQTDLSVIDDMIQKGAEYLQNKTFEKSDQSNSTEPQGLLDAGIDAAAEIIKESAKIVMQVQEAFGSNYTFNPLPVRVSVGQYMDIEPLVITNINTTFSKETFINYSGSDKGRHLPITVTVDITFEYWLNPAPDLQFTSLLGQELFGTDPIPNKSKVETYSSSGGQEPATTFKELSQRNASNPTFNNFGRYGNPPL